MKLKTRIQKHCFALIIIAIMVTSLACVHIASALPPTADVAIEPDRVENIFPPDEFTVDLTVVSAADIQSWEANVTFDPTVLEVVSCAEGEFLKRKGLPTNFFFDIRLEHVLFSATYLMIGPPGSGVTGDGTLGNITFRVKAGGSTPIHLDEEYTNLYYNNGTAPAYQPRILHDGFFTNVPSPCIAVIPRNIIVSDLTPGKNFTVSIYTNYGENVMTEWDVTAYQFNLFYNPDILNGITVTNGEVIVGGTSTFLAGPFDNEAGELSLTVGFYDSEGEVTSMYRPAPWNGTLAYVTFTVVGTGTSTITIGPRTKLVGWNFTVGEAYHIIDAETMPTHIQHGYFRNAIEPVIHDIAVVSVVPSSTSVRLGELVNITVVVENQGTANETFNVTIYYDNTAIETKTVLNLVAGLDTSLTFIWDTASVSEDIYASPGHRKTFTLKAVASVVPGETETEDNTFWYHDVYVFAPHYIRVIPESTVDPTLTPGKNYTVSIYTDYNGSDIWAWQFDLSYNPLVLHGVEVVNGDLITTDKDPSAQFIAGTFDNTVGRLSLTAGFFFFTEKPVPITSGPGILANVTFTVVGMGDSDITLDATPKTMPRDTELIGWTDGGMGEDYKIIDFITPDIGHIIDGFFQNVEAVYHDIAVVSVTPFPTSVIRGELVNITVAVKNNGTVDEVVTVKMYRSIGPYDPYNPRLIDKKTAWNLAAGASTSLSFVWNTADVPAENYTITAVAEPVPRETYVDDNTLESEETVTVTTAGVHDIAVISVSASPTQVTAGELITFNVTVWNQGSFNETFEVRVYYDSITIDTRVESLSPGNLASLSISWNTTGVVPGVYTTMAEAILTGDADPTDNMLVDGAVTVTSPPAPPTLSIKLSGEHDYLLMENVKVRLAALVKDVAAMEPVSDADVTIEIYDADGVLWVSGVMVEMVTGTGIYEWQSEGTIRQLRLAKGVYLVHVQASCQGGPTASDILAFHIDPPAEGTNPALYYVAFTAIALVGLAGLIRERRKIANGLRQIRRRS